ncbi:hypothetical protein OPQ81_009034 [Rhizoctonia solani]|nr:hypothetical protein OPQ81_009034 [Rhizoctonia solani]
MRMSKPAHSEVTVKTKHFDPNKNGSRGLLLGRFKREIYSNGSQTLYEIDEMFRRVDGWIELDGGEYKNEKSNDVELEVTRRRAFEVDGSIYKANRLGFINDNTEKPETTKVTVKPGETLYRYKGLEYGIFRKWWIAKFDDQEHAVTRSDSDEETLDALINYTVSDRVLTRNTELTGEQYFDYTIDDKELIQSPSDDKLLRSQLSDIPNELQTRADARWKEAIGEGSGSETWAVWTD